MEKRAFITTDPAACGHSNQSVDAGSAETSMSARKKRDSILLPANKAHLAAVDCVCRCSALVCG